MSAAILKKISKINVRLLYIHERIIFWHTLDGQVPHMDKQRMIKQFKEAGKQYEKQKAEFKTEIKNSLA